MEERDGESQTIICDPRSGLPMHTKCEKDVSKRFWNTFAAPPLPLTSIRQVIIGEEYERGGLELECRNIKGID
jgi:hypothetical protein